MHFPKCFDYFVLTNSFWLEKIQSLLLYFKYSVLYVQLNNPNSLISRTDKVELIATEFSQQSCDCLGYLEQHTKSCKSYLVGKYIYFRFKDDHVYALSGY